MTKAGLPMDFIREAFAYEGDHCRLWPYALNSAGYGHLSLNGKDILAHRLICQMAHGPAPIDRPESAHSCGNGHKRCINKRHLSWKSRKGNAEDMVAHGRSTRGHKQHMAKLDEDAVRFIRANVAKLTPPQMAEQFGVTRSVIHQVINGTCWGWVS